MKGLPGRECGGGCGAHLARPRGPQHGGQLPRPGTACAPLQDHLFPVPTHAQLERAPSQRHRLRLPSTRLPGARPPPREREGQHREPRRTRGQHRAGHRAGRRPHELPRAPPHPRRAPRDCPTPLGGHTPPASNLAPRPLPEPFLSLVGLGKVEPEEAGGGQAVVTVRGERGAGVGGAEDGKGVAVGDEDGGPAGGRERG